MIHIAIAASMTKVRCSDFLGRLKVSSDTRFCVAGNDIIPGYICSADQAADGGFQLLDVDIQGT